MVVWTQKGRELWVGCFGKGPVADEIVRYVKSKLLGAGLLREYGELTNRQIFDYARSDMF